MNTKFLFVLLLVTLVASACAPAIVDGAAPIVPAVQAENNQPAKFIPVTSKSAERDTQESRQWSGEISLSDQNSPDLKFNHGADINSQTSAQCVAEDSQPKRQSGCIE